MQITLNITRRGVALAVTAALAVVGVAACTEDAKPPNAQEQAQNTAANRVNYIPKNDVEGKNYNARQALADNPASIIWCTVYPANPGVKPFTVPVVGKLTSGNKRPYPTEVNKQYTDSGSYFPELPGNDGFYGSSGDYRYGFGPDGVYEDFTDIATFCTSAPTLIQKQTTQIAITSDGDTTSLDQRAETALKACRAKNADPSVSCPEAAKILGVS